MQWADPGDEWGPIDFHVSAKGTIAIYWEDLMPPDRAEFLIQRGWVIEKYPPVVVATLPSRAA